MQDIVPYSHIQLSYHLTTPTCMPDVSPNLMHTSVRCKKFNTSLIVSENEQILQLHTSGEIESIFYKYTRQQNITVQKL